MYNACPLALWGGTSPDHGRGSRGRSASASDGGVPHASALRTPRGRGLHRSHDGRLRAEASRSIRKTDALARFEARLILRALQPTRRHGGG
eukprot:7903862-Pyramimonas_sp.AAC.1